MRAAEWGYGRRGGFASGRAWKSARLCTSRREVGAPRCPYDFLGKNFFDSTINYIIFPMLIKDYKILKIH